MGAADRGIRMFTAQVVMAARTYTTPNTMNAEVWQHRPEAGTARDQADPTAQAADGAGDADDRTGQLARVVGALGRVAKPLDCAAASNTDRIILYTGFIAQADRMNKRMKPTM